MNRVSVVSTPYLELQVLVAKLTESISMREFSRSFCLSPFLFEVAKLFIRLDFLVCKSLSMRMDFVEGFNSVGNMLTAFVNLVS